MSIIQITAWFVLAFMSLTLGIIGIAGLATSRVEWPPDMHPIINDHLFWTVSSWYDEERPFVCRSYQSDGSTINVNFHGWQPHRFDTETFEEAGSSPIIIFGQDINEEDVGSASRPMGIDVYPDFTVFHNPNEYTRARIDQPTHYDQ